MKVVSFYIEPQKLEKERVSEGDMPLSPDTTIMLCVVFMLRWRPISQLYIFKKIIIMICEVKGEKEILCCVM